MMFEAAELGRTIAKETFRAEVPVLRTELLGIQQQLSSASFPVIVVFAGVDGAGKGETVNLLNEWMDPEVHRHACVWRSRPSKKAGAPGVLALLARSAA